MNEERSLGRIMALDVGDARVGVALSDPLRMFAQPHSTLERNRKIFGTLVELVRQEGVNLVVIGLPKTMGGEIADQAQKVLDFQKKLENSLRSNALGEVRTALWDERLTSVSAERLIQGSKLRDKNRRALLDQVSATLILESYMDSIR